MTASATPLQRTLLTALTLSLIACGPKLTSLIPQDSAMPQTLAVLPPDYVVDIPQERVDLIHSAITQELRNQKFLVVEPAVIRSLCSTPACPEREEIAKRFLVDGFVTIRPSSFSKTNFIAGYYNQLSGELTISDRTGKELLEVSHSQNESGGVLLESGQVIQGIISQVKNSSEDVFEDLAEKFAKSVVGALPAAAAGNLALRAEGAEVALMSTSTAWKTPSTLAICAKGTPHSFAFLQVGSTHTALRETSPGEYCALFSAVTLSSNPATGFIELRSAYGSSARRDIALPLTSPCSLANRIAYTPATGSGKITVACAAVGDDRSQATVGCSDTVPQCAAQKLLVYRSVSKPTAFVKAGEISSASATLPQSSADLGSDNEVTVVAVQAGGVYSQPVTVKR